MHTVRCSIKRGMRLYAPICKVFWLYIFVAKYLFPFVFASFSTATVNGHVTINGRSRDLRLFRRQVAYIMQEDILQKHITVWEAMYFSASLKIGSHMSQTEKKNRVRVQLKFQWNHICVIQISKWHVK